jgi:DNA-binding NtrC family response regulator
MVSSDVVAGLETTLTSIDALPIAVDRLVLLVLREGEAFTFALPDRGEVSIGRSTENEIAVDDPMISRRHALITTEASGVLWIEDLGGTNGTRLSGQPIPPRSKVALETGRAIEVGATMMVVQRARRSAGTRRLWPYAFFEMRLEDECRRRPEKKGFSVLWISGAGPDIEATLHDLLHPEDLVARPYDGVYALLLPGATEGRTEELRGELEASFVGVARCPRDGRTPDALLDAARGQRPQPREPAAEDPAMADLHRIADKIARGRISVLILGETGTGKEVLAETIHARSPRKDRPLLRLNCGALTETLLESELFGYEKGAFTGADQVKQGLIESADGGTVFLDEVGELPPATQVKLLRVLEQREVLRVGSLAPRSIDVRFLAATNRNLEEEIARGTFRQDLFFRLSAATVTIPPLRERPMDLDRLARRFVERAAEENGERTPAISGEAMRLLRAYAWPGNIRELKNVMERAVLLGTDGTIEPEHLPLERLSARWIAKAPRPEGGEREEIMRALEACGGNQTRAAKLLSMSRRTLVRKIAQHQLPRPKD